MMQERIVTHSGLAKVNFSSRAVSASSRMLSGAKQKIIHIDPHVADDDPFLAFGVLFQLFKRPNVWLRCWRHPALLASFTFPADGLARGISVGGPVSRTFQQPMPCTLHQPPFLATYLDFLGNRRRGDQSQLELWHQRFRTHRTQPTSCHFCIFIRDGLVATSNKSCFSFERWLNCCHKLSRDHLDVVSSLKLLVLLSVDGFDGLVLQEGIVFRFDWIVPFSQLFPNFIQGERFCDQGLLLFDRRLKLSYAPKCSFKSLNLIINILQCFPRHVLVPNLGFLSSKTMQFIVL